MSDVSRATRLITAAVAVAAAIVIGAVFLTRFSPPFVVFMRVVPQVAAALLVAAASLGIGALVGTPASSPADQAPSRRLEAAGRRLISRRDGGVPEDEFLIGVALYGTLLAIVALLGLVHPIAVFAITIVAAAYGALARWRAVVALVREVRVQRIAILVLPIAIALIGAIAPVNTPDELSYKLAVPKAYALAGRMVELPLNSDSYFPAAVYMADLGAVMFAGGVAAKLLHFLLYLVALRVIYRFSSRLSGDDTMWPTAVIAWTPALAIIAGWAWAEWAMIAFVLLSLLRWQDFLESSRAADLAISAAALGCALASKYTALPWLAVFLPLALWNLRARNDRWRILGTAALIVLATGGFFYARNLAWTGSPIAPFLLPNSPSVTEYRSSAGGWTELLLGYDILHAKIIDDSLGIVLPAMVLLSPFALLRRNRRITDTFVIGLAQLVILISIAPTARLMMLGIVPLAILGAIAIADVWRTAASWMRAVLATIAAAGFYAQFMLVAFLFVTAWHFLPYLAGAETEEAYLERSRDFTKPYAWIADNTPSEAKLLLLAENRTFHLERRSLAAGNLDGPRVAAYLERFRSEDELLHDLQQQRITHVLVHKPWYRVGSSPAGMVEKEYLLEVSPRVDAMLHRLAARYARPVYQDRAYVIYELPPATGR